MILRDFTFDRKFVVNGGVNTLKAGDCSVFIPAFAFAVVKDKFLDMTPGIG